MISLEFRYWWLSFIDPKKTGRRSFLGVCIVRAPTLEAALTIAHVRKCNPGGEAMGAAVPVEYGAPPSGFFERLITDRRAINRFGREWLGDEGRAMSVGEWEEETGREIGSELDVSANGGSNGRS